MNLSPPEPATSGFELHLRAHPDLGTDPRTTGRVIRPERGGAEILTLNGSLIVETTEALCAGDWVVLDGDTIAQVLPRRTAILRQAADGETAQVLAANVDDVWIVISLDREVSLGRLERSLVLAWESGAEPVVIATKADLCDEGKITESLAGITGVSPGVETVVVSTVTGAGLSTLADRLSAGRTAALLGSSGAGKSTLINALMGDEAQAVGAVRDADGKGRHTTTWRHLTVLPNGGALIDTPGLRSVGLWIDQGGIDAAFSDVSDLIPQCRFSDCEHRTEPGCAVLEAIAEGTLDPRRLESYRKLQAEAAWIERRHDARAAAVERRIWAARTREARARTRHR